MQSFSFIKSVFTTAHCSLFPYSAVMCNIVFTLKIPPRAGDVKPNLIILHSNWDPSYRQRDFNLDSKSCKVLPPLGTRDCDSYFKVLLPMGTVTAISAHFLSLPFPATLAVGKNNYSLLKKGKKELCINLVSLKKSLDFVCCN